MRCCITSLSIAAFPPYSLPGVGGRRSATRTANAARVECDAVRPIGEPTLPGFLFGTIQMDRIVGGGHPAQGEPVMLVTVVLRQLDIGAVDVVDGAKLAPVRADDRHMLTDLGR